MRSFALLFALLVSTPLSTEAGGAGHGEEAGEEGVSSTLHMQVNANQKEVQVSMCDGKVCEFKAGDLITVGEEASTEINIVEKTEEAAAGAVSFKMVLKYPFKGFHPAGAKVEQMHKIESKNYGSTVLICAIVAIFVIYYLTNWPDDVVKKMTWSTLVEAVSIFTAVMAFSSGHTLRILLTQDAKHALSDHAGTDSSGLADHVKHRRLSEESEPHDIPSGAVLFACFWIIVVANFAINRHSILRLHASGKIGGHMLGFAVIGLFGRDVAQRDSFDTPLTALLVLLMYFFIVPLIMLFTKAVFQVVKNKMDEEDAERFHEQALDTGMDFFAMGGSFLISQYIRGLVMYNRIGHMADFKTYSGHHEPGEIGAMVSTGIGFGLLSTVLGFFEWKQKVIAKAEAERSGKTYKQGTTAIIILGTFCKLTAAWVLLDTSNWYWLSRFVDRPFIGKLIVACTWSVIFIAFTIIFSLLPKDAEHFLKGELLALGLAFGLAWEHIFDTAVEVSSEQLAGGKETAAQAHACHMFVICFCMLIFFIVYPAWAVWMLPKVDKEVAEETSAGELHFWHAFCGYPDQHSDVDLGIDESSAALGSTKGSVAEGASESAPVPSTVGASASNEADPEAAVAAAPRAQKDGQNDDPQAAPAVALSVESDDRSGGPAIIDLAI